MHGRRYAFRIFLFTLFFPFALCGQGKLVLVGGGAEVEGGWSDVPYRWAVEQSANKNVAVISYADEDNFIPDYFVSLGAAAATNIKINSRDLADAAATYDLLMTNDVFFFKGGDQSLYYQYFKDTRTAQAIADKFQEGGVIAGTSAGMAILSGVIFTADNGSVYPDEALRDFKQSKIALADDFLALYPGFIFDSHFTERGRVARLLAFMANWFSSTGALLTGIGVDDRTALCIDADEVGTVYGTGSVSFYNSTGFTSYQDDKPVADSVHAVQLLHGHRINLQQGNIVVGPGEWLPPAPTDETGNYHVVLSGGEGVSANAAFLSYLVNSTGAPGDTVMLVTAPGKGTTYRQRLLELGAKSVVIETSAVANDPSQIDLRNSIRRSRKILFAENDDALLFGFLAGGPTGALIDGHMRRNTIVSAFAGDDSRYAGKVFVTNHTSDGYAAYYGRLTFRPGLALLPASVIMANTYDAATTDFYENTTAAVSYAMMADSVRYGVYLNRSSNIHCGPVAGTNRWKAAGMHSAMVMVNSGTHRAFASQPVNAAGAKRQYAGFSSMRYALLNGDATIEAGASQPSIDLPYEFETAIVGLEQDFNRSSLNLFPNPSANGIFYLDWSMAAEASFIVTDALGRRLKQGKCAGTSRQPIDLGICPDGIYFLTLRSATHTLVRKMIKGAQGTRAFSG